MEVGTVFNSESKALQGLRVLDMTQFLAGPYCGMYLADLGAEVIKIENPPGGDFMREIHPRINGVSMYYENMNRNKKSVTVNLKSAEGKELFWKLIETADILVENNRPGVMERLGFGYEQARRINERLIYASISGFGQSGPYSQRPGYDLIAQAMSGAMSLTGMPGQDPLKSGIPIGDILGGMNGVIGILAAVIHRNQTGKGQYIDVSLLDSLVSSLQTTTMLYLVTGQIPGRTGNRYQNAYPYDSFIARDGEYVLACGTDPHFKALAEAMGMPELVDDERFNGMEPRKANAEALKVIIDQWGNERSADECIDIFMRAGIPVGPIYDLKQVVEDPHLRDAREMFVELEHPVAGRVTITGSPIRMSAASTAIERTAALLGENNAEIFGEIGIGSELLREYKAQGIV